MDRGAVLILCILFSARRQPEDAAWDWSQLCGGFLRPDCLLPFVVAGYCGARYAWDDVRCGRLGDCQFCVRMAGDRRSLIKVAHLAVHQPRVSRRTRIAYSLALSMLRCLGQRAETAAIQESVDRAKDSVWLMAFSLNLTRIMQTPHRFATSLTGFQWRSSTQRHCLVCEGAVRNRSTRRLSVHSKKMNWQK